MEFGEDEMNTTDEDIASELAFVTMDCALADVGLDESPTRLASATRREARRPAAVEAARPSPFLSIAELTARWGCGRTFAYEAVAEMEAGGYLKRLWLGRVQRLSIESVQTWEALHSKAGVDSDRATIAVLRTETSPRAPARVASRRRSPRAPAPARSTGIVDAWRALSRRVAG
jgi:hypothetical protein